MPEHPQPPAASASQIQCQSLVVHLDSLHGDHAWLCGWLSLYAGSGSNDPFWVICISILSLHIVSSLKLSNGRSGWLAFALIFGGWVLMLAALSAGCMAVIGQIRDDTA